MGGLPFLVQALGLKAPVYVTVPMVSLGKALFYDMQTNAIPEMIFQSGEAEDDVRLPVPETTAWLSSEAIEATLAQLVPLRYSQPVILGDTLEYVGECQLLVHF
jgi:Cft2 family RNA processing exonuclease